MGQMKEKKERKVFKRKEELNKDFQILQNNVQFINESNSWKMNRNFEN